MCRIADEYSCNVVKNRYLLTGPKGISLELSPEGARLCRLWFPGRGGVPENIVLDSADPSVYAGCILGPVAGRLAGARLPVGDQPLPLDANENGNTLHGGTHNLSRQQWACTESGETENSAWVEFSCALPHGLDGFPGNRQFRVRYLLSGGFVRLTLSARTDRPTFINLSSHVYWNLSGNFSVPCAGQQLEVNAQEVLYNDARHLPTDLHPCAGSAFDFQRPASPVLAAEEAGRRPPLPESDSWQLRNGRGYNNGYRLCPGAPFAARLTDAASGRRLTLSTDCGWLVVYSGGFLSCPGSALALEAQERPGSTRPLLQPGETYLRHITFHLEHP